MATVTLLNKRKGPICLKPLQSSKEPRVWAGGTTIKVEEEEAKKLLNYHDVVQLKGDGVAAAKPQGAVPVPAGAGVSGKAALPDDGAKKK